MSDLIFITDEFSWDAVIREGLDELTEDEARAEFKHQGVDFDDDCLVFRQAFLEGDASKSEYDRVFYPVEETGHPSAYIGWAVECG